MRMNSMGKISLKCIRIFADDYLTTSFKFKLTNSAKIELNTKGHGHQKTLITCFWSSVNRLRVTGELTKCLYTISNNL